jgi:hypothetical protein
VEGCFVHDCQNREFDLVDDNGVTNIAGSHALISGCVIVKAPNASGNKTVIHFGQDGGYDHTGTLYIVQSTIVTPYISPVVDLSAPGAGVNFTNSLVLDPSRVASGQVLVSTRGGALISNASGHYMWMSSGFSAPSGGTFDHVTIGAPSFLPAFVDASVGNYGLADSESGIVDAGLAYSSITLPQPLASRQPVAFQVPLGFFARTFSGAPDIGAYEWKNGPNMIRNPAAHFPGPRNLAGTSTVDLRGRVISPAQHRAGTNGLANGLYLTRSEKYRSMAQKIVAGK